MKIARIDTFPVRVPLKPERRMKSALGSHEVSEYLLLRLVTDNGLEGAGEATVMPRWSGETVWSARSIVDRVFAPALIGADPTDIAAVDGILDAAAKDNWFAKSAVEMACWDVTGKAAGKPVYELLGGLARDRTFKCRFSMGAYDAERARRTVASLIERGFDTIKVKVGTDPDADFERVAIVREVIGPDRTITIDANSGWDAETAIAFVERIRPLNVQLFEQPTRRHDYAGLARVRHEADIPVMADDTLFDFEQAVECLRHQACDVVNLYPGKNGGLRKAVAIAELAAEHDVAASIGSNLELDVATAAMAHFVVGTPNMQVERFPGDVLGPVYHEFSVVKEPVPIDGPYVTCPNGPGLGVEVDWELVARCPVE